MENSIITIGIDVSKEKLDISLNNKHYQYDNSDIGIDLLMNFAKEQGAKKLVCEATGGYEMNLICHCNAANILICRVNPRQVRDFAKASGKLAKTDKLDAQILVEFAQTFSLQPTNLSENIGLMELIRHRQNLVTAKADNLKRHGKFHKDFVKNSIEKVIETLVEEINLCDASIRTLIDEDKSLKDKENILKSFCGIGAVTAGVLLAEMPELGTISAQQVAALAGLAPYNADSGRKTGKRAIRGGRKIVRNALYMAAMVAVRYNHTIKLFYNRLKERNKSFKVAIVAVMRKILVTLNAMLKNNQQWNKNKLTQA